MAVIGWIILGLLAGTVVRSLLPAAPDSGERAVTLILGVVGALLGGFIASLVFAVGIQDFFRFSTWLLALAGSAIVLGVYALATSRARKDR